MLLRGSSQCVSNVTTCVGIVVAVAQVMIANGRDAEATRELYTASDSMLHSALTLITLGWIAVLVAILCS